MSHPLLIDESWIVQHLDDFWILHYGIENICTREHWRELKRMVDKFYATYSDEEIEEIFQQSKMHRRADVQPQKEEKVHEPQRGCIYLLHGSDTSWYKIGITKNVAQRLKSLGTLCPFKLHLLDWFNVDDMHSVEIYWHSRFSNKRVEGEWFELSDEDVAEFILQEGQINE